MKKILIALLAFISFSCPVFASDWVYLGKTPDGELVYMDKESIQKSYGMANGWTKFVKPDGSSVLWNISARKYDRSLSWTFFLVYDAEGNSLGQYPSSHPEYNPVPPDTLAEIIYNILIANT